MVGLARRLSLDTAAAGVDRPVAAPSAPAGVAGRGRSRWHEHRYCARPWPTGRWHRRGRPGPCAGRRSPCIETIAEYSAALDAVRLVGPDGRGGAHHGRAARRPPLPHRAGRARVRRGGGVHLRQSDPVRRPRRPGPLPAYPRRRPRAWWRRPAAASVFAPSVAEMYPDRPGVAADHGVGAGAGRPVGGRLPAGPLRRGGHRGGQAAVGGRPVPGLLRREGLPAAGPGAPGGPRPRACRPRWSGARPCATPTAWPCPAGTPGSSPSSAGPRWSCPVPCGPGPPWWAGARPVRRRWRRRWPGGGRRARWWPWTTPPWSTPTTSSRPAPVPPPARSGCSSRPRSGPVRLIDNLDPRTGRH